MDIHVAAGTDPAYQAAQKIPEGLLPSTDQILKPCSDSILLIDDICLRFTLDFSKPQRPTRSSGQYEMSVIMIRDIRCLICFISVDKEIWKQMHEVGIFLLIAVDHTRGYIVNHLIMIRSEPGRELAL